jgi:hypothetical protein
MGSTRDKADGEGWVARIFAALVCGMSDRNFDAVLRQRLAGSAIRGAGKSLRFYLPDVVAALVAYRLEQAAPAATVGPDADPLLAGGDSPNLERYRGAKADREEMARDRDRGTHANLRDLHTTLMRFGGLIRRGGEVLQRRFGPDAADLFNEAIDEAERECVAAIAGAAGADGPQVPPPAP